ncbi:MAG TPA: hypothetical protein VKF41_11345 [Bryobacteraceae bacterium]|nr:hypothetical protein [Bryobacteraceae bacterium]
MSASIVAPQAVAVVNDDEVYQDSWSLQLREAGYEPYVVRRPDSRPFQSIGELADEVERHAPLAVIDHRLAPKGLAQFSGAAAIAELYDRRRTASLLVTTWEQQDANTTIRLHRRRVPVLMSPQDFDDPETIRRCFASCAREVRDRQVPMERRPWRTAVLIEGRHTDSTFAVVDALVPGWNPELKVTFPLDLIQAPLCDRATQGQLFFALVNIGAERGEDLFFSDFELAPDPDPNDGLA